MKTRSTIGRDVEVGFIRELLTELEDGPRALFLVGPPGIGKTRLWSDGVALARSQGVRVLSTRPAGADARVAMGAVRDLLHESAEDVLPELPEPQRRALAVALLLEDAGPGALDPDAVSAAILGALRILSAADPLLVAIDDAQWLDASSRAALAFALRRLESERVGILATVRVEHGVNVDDLLLALGNESVERRELTPLTVAALYELVRERFDLSLARPTLLRLHELSEGNPFFAIELARGLSEDQQLKVPRELSELLRTRLAATSERTQDVLLAAAALAQPTLDVLERIDEAVDTALDEAVSAEVLEDEPGVVRFTHPLLASVHYTGATLSARRAVHRRLAEAGLEAEERARHLALAAEGPSEDVALALDEAVASVQRRGGLAAAAELAALSVAMTPADDSGLHARALVAARLISSAGDVAEAERLALEALDSATDDRQRVELSLLLGEIVYYRDYSASYRHFLAALERAGGDDRLRVDALGWLAGGAFAGVSRDEALAYGETAVRVAERTGDPLVLVNALSCLAEARYFHTGEISRELHERAMALAESTADDAAASKAASAYANAVLDSWELDTARETLAPLAARLRARGDSELASHLDMLAFVELGSGNLDLAADHDREAADLAAQGGRTGTEVWALFRLGWIEALRGNIAEARNACARSVRLAELSTGFVRGARLTLGYLESALGNYEAAWSYLDPANPLTGTMPPGRPVLHVPESVEVLVALGRIDEARELLEPFQERAEALGRVWAIALTAHCSSLILAVEDDLEEAEQEALRAVELTEANGWPLQLGRDLLALGSVQRRQRRKADARLTLERAIDVLGGMGARIWEERARKELRRIGGRSAPAGAELSETEARIAALVAEGRTNAEVAQTLHLSHKTVEWNLSKIYRKLGVRSRTELAARIPAD